MSSNILGRLAVVLGLDSAAFEQGLTKAQKQANSSAKEIQKSFKEFGKSFEDILGPLGEFGSQFTGQFGKMGQQISSVVRQLGPLGQSFGAVGTVAVGATAGLTVFGAAAVALAISGAEVVEQIEHLSEKTGISRTELVAWGAVAKANGTNLEAFEVGVKKLEVAISGVTPQGKVAREVLHDLGVTAKDPQEALLLVADAFQKMPDGAQKAATAVAIFGRSGTEMIPILNQGRDAIIRWQNQAAELGRNISNNAKAAQDWRNKTVELSLSWDNFKVSLVGILGVIANVDNKFGAMLDKAAAYSDALQGRTWALPGARSIGNAAKDFQAVADAELESAKAQLELAGAQGPAEARLLQIRRQITEEERAGTLASVTRAINLKNELPSLQKAADLERQRRADMERMAELTARRHAEFEASMKSPASGIYRGNHQYNAPPPSLLDQANEIAGSFGPQYSNFPDLATGGRVVTQGEQGPDSFRAAWDQTFAYLRADGDNFASNIMQSIGGAIQHLNKELGDFVTTGKGLDFKKLFQNLGSNIIQSALGKAESSLFGALGFGGKRDGSSPTSAIWVAITDVPNPANLLGGATGSSGGIGGFFKSLVGGLSFGGAFAGGGSTSPGMSYLVGEAGPEIFTPGVTGTVSPMRSAVVYQIDARGADAGAEERIRMALRDTENRAVARSIHTSNELQKRR